MKVFDPNNVDVADLLAVIREFNDRLANLEGATGELCDGLASTADGTPGTVDRTRDWAVQAAIHLEHELPPVAILSPGHLLGGFDGDRLPTDEEVDAMNQRARVVEAATLDRVFKNAEAFHAYMKDGVTPAAERAVMLDVGLRRLTEGDGTDG
jgi:hypothetical protein